MDIKKLNETLSKALNESKDDDKNALANFLEIDIENLSEEPDFEGMSQFTVVNNDENEGTYAISSDTKLIEKNVAEHMEELFYELGYEEFKERIIPHLNGEVDDYIKIDFKKMAKHVINLYGAGHELASADASTDEVEYNGKIYYIFRED